MTTHDPKPAQGAATATERMQAVKAAWDKAPPGPKKDAAHTHYAAAEKALAAHDEKAALQALEAATRALH